jgi:hypothetical protein
MVATGCTRPVSRLDDDPKQQRRHPGLASTECAVPGNDFWFVGSGAVVGRRGRLYLSNPESVPAVVDVALYGPEGPIDAPGGRGVTLAAGAQQVLKLDALAPDVERFGVHVQVRQGRVAAALRTSRSRAHPLGADWCRAPAPAHRLVLPACRPARANVDCRSSTRATRTPSCGSG